MTNPQKPYTGMGKAYEFFFYLAFFLLFGCVLPWIITGVYLYKGFIGKCI